jgi:hypothetical protein
MWCIRIRSFGWWWVIARRLKREAEYREVNAKYADLVQQGFGLPQATLDPAIGRSNLSVITGATARRLLLEGERCVGVVYEHRGRQVEARVRREVILCGGSYNSPQLLLLSGIGPADEIADPIARRITCPRPGTDLRPPTGPVALHRRGTAGEGGHIVRIVAN